MKDLKSYICEKLIINKDTEWTDVNGDKDGLTNKELEKLEKFFKDNVRHIENITTNNGIFSIYFDSSLRTSQNAKAHLVVSKPPRSNGGYNICLYKAGRWMAQNIGGKLRKKGSNEPLLYSIDEVIDKLEKNFLHGKWAEDLGAELKH